MDPNKFYCRSNNNNNNNNGSQTPSIASSSSSVSSSAAAAIAAAAATAAAATAASSQIGQDIVPKGKSQQLNRGTNTGNYINVVPVPIGVQYHRRKLTPQEYQSRLYYNGTDYRCREDYYNLAPTSGRLSTTSPSPSLQQQQQHQQQQPQQSHQQQQQQQLQLQQQQHHQQHQEQQHQQQQQQQQQQHHHQHHHVHQQHHHQQQQQQTQQHHQQQQQQQQHLHQQHCTDIVDEVLNSSRVVATQTSNGNCEQIVSTGFGSTNGVGGGGSSASTLPPPPVLYTVHRVVTTAQIQTAGGNTFASSSSVSSVVSALRGGDAAECLTAAVSGASGGVGGVGGGTSAAAATAAAIASAGGLRSSPGTSTNSNYQPHQQPCSSEVQHQQQQQQHSSSRISNNFNSTTSSSNTNYSSGAKSSTSIPRPLQNVIPTCVYLMSRIAVHMEIEGTAQCPSQVMLAAALGCEELGIANKLLAQSIFGLWMTSALLEIQLKSHHRPYVVRIAWQSLLEKFSHGNPIEKKYDEPMIMLKRNVFFSKKDEEKIKDHRILELLYEEAKHNVLTGRYIMEPVHSVMLGGIQARIELGPYNSHTHTISFFRENQSRFLPQHVAKNSSWSWLPVSRKNSAEVKLLEQYKRVPQTATTRKLMRKYLEFCWALPFYGAAFFHGQVEQPVRGLMSLVNHKDVSVIVAINERGIFIIDPVEYTLLLGLRYEDLSWDFAKPSASDDPECQTCIFLQFDAVENGIQISKLMQIFSRQAAMMDALIAHFAEQMRRRREGGDGNVTEHIHDEPNPIQNNGNGVLCNKLSRLTLATFDDEGRCIGQMGSLSISY